jgi:thiol-disulfide isomerase/thioredoxin
MKNLLTILLIIAAATGTRAQGLKAYTVADIMKRASTQNGTPNDTIYVINFWSTWCAPCVAELHEFNTLEKKFEGKPLKVLLVSIDFPEDYKTDKLEAFVHKKHLTPEVVWLNETNPNDYVPAVDNSWQGSIPATLMIYPKKGTREFLEGSITAGKLKRIADKWLQ